VTFVGSTLFIEANPAGMIAPSSAINATNAISTISTTSITPVSTTYGAALPSAAGAGGLAVNTNQPPLKIVSTEDGKGIILEPAERPRQ
jgi:hypothetical protein